MNINTDDKNISKFTNISSTFIRFVSKEGCGEFPTVVMLSNRMFLSEKNNLIKDMKLPYKIKQGVNYMWYKDRNVRESIKNVVLDTIIPGGFTCFKPYNDLEKGISAIWNIDNCSYFIKNNQLYYGTLKRKYLIKESTINLSDIKYIYRCNNNVDCVFTPTNVYLINVATHVCKNIITADNGRVFNDITFYQSDKIIIATSNKGLIYRGSNGISFDSTFTKLSYEMEYKSWTILNPDYIPPDPETGEGGSGTQYITVDNGMPPSNVLTVCKNNNNSSIYIGDASHTTSFSRFEDSEKGDSSGLIIAFHKLIGKDECYKYSGSSYNLGDLVYDLSYEPIGYYKSSDIIYIYDKNHIDCYKGQKLITSFNSNNNFSNCENMICYEKDKLYYLSNQGVLYESIRNSDKDYEFDIIPIDFIYERDKKTKKINCTSLKFNIKELLSILSDDDKLNKLVSVYGIDPSFASLYLNLKSVETFFYFGNDDRNKAAKEVKDISNAFEIRV